MAYVFVDFIFSLRALNVLIIAIWMSSVTFTLKFSRPTFVGLLFSSVLMVVFLHWWLGMLVWEDCSSRNSIWSCLFE